MVKFFKKPDAVKSKSNHYKYSVYMQSKDSDWLNRNISSNQPQDDPEPIEEDIRD